MRAARFSSSWRGLLTPPHRFRRPLDTDRGLCQTPLDADPPLMDRQAPVKTLPCCKLRLRAVIKRLSHKGSYYVNFAVVFIFYGHVLTSMHFQNVHKSLTLFTFSKCSQKFNTVYIFKVQKSKKNAKKVNFFRWRLKPNLFVTPHNGNDVTLIPSLNKRDK